MKKQIKSLNEEITEIQIENFINDFTKAMKKEHKKTFKRLLVLVIPGIAFISGIIIFPKTITMILGSIVMTIAFTLAYVIENEISIKKIINKRKNNIINLNTEQVKEVEEILEKGISPAPEFYSKTAKNILETTTVKNDKCTNENIKSNFTIINGTNTQNKIDKTKIMIQIAKEIDLYYKTYNINKWKITTEQWNFFIDTLYNFFIQKKLENIFYEELSKLCRVTLANAVVNKEKTITIKNFIDNLKILENNYTSTENSISEKEILIIQKEILTNIYSDKIIDINQYIKSKHI